MSKCRFVCASLVAALMLVGLAAEATAGGPVRAGLFENYYVNPSIVGSMGAKMYPSPRPVPAWVGHTYYTYEGLYPHEHMYPHMRHYYKGKGPLGIVPMNVSHVLYW
jgi:hypothetical protein